VVQGLIIVATVTLPLPLRSLARLLVAYGVVAVLWIVASSLIPGFGVFAHLRYIVALGAIIGLAAIGQTLAVIGGGIDLSLSAIITVAAVVLPMLSFPRDTTGLGAVNGRGIGYPGLPPLIMTLVIATILQGVLVLIAGGSAVSVENTALTWFGSSDVFGISRTIIVSAVAAAVTLFWLHGTRGGALIFAIGTNPTVSQLSGVPVQRITLWIYVVAGICAGIAGLLLLAMNGQGYVGIGDPYLLSSIAAVVLGGTSILGGQGTYLGTIAGAVLLVTMTALITVINASQGWRSVILGCLILGLLRCRAATNPADGERRNNAMPAEELDTPSAVVDLDVMEANPRRAQSHLAGAGLAVRRHIKTPTIPDFARLQLKLGGRGITCQKLDEAEAMADAGIADILLSYNIVGRIKLDRLVTLAHRADIKVRAEWAMICTTHNLLKLAGAAA
jgi:ribose transport system permease protein